jgi:hypothetical protein
VDVVSTFFDFDGAASSVAGVDPDRYDGWAMWSGTSFAAPQVAAAIAKRMCDSGLTASEAAVKVIEEGTPVEDLGMLVTSDPSGDVS